MPELELISALPGHAEPAWQVSFNPTLPLLASCSTDKTFRIYSYALPSAPPSDASSAEPTGFLSKNSAKPSFQLVKTVKTEHKRTIRSIAWAPSGRTLATGSFDSTVALWEETDDSDDDDSQEEDEDEDVDMDQGGMQGGVYKPGKEGAGQNWECVTTLEGHESECKGVGFSYDGGLLGSCSRDKSVWVWEVQPDADFECIAVMMEHTQDVKTIAWHPKEEILASASYDAQIHLLFDDPDGDWCIFQKLHPHLPQSSLHVEDPSPSLRAALEASEEDKAVEQLGVPPLEEDETVWSLGWSPCGRYLASGGDLGGIRIWKRKGSNPDSLFEEVVHTAAHTRSVFSLSWSTGGLSPDQGGLGLLASAGGDGKIVIWQLTAAPSGGETADATISISPIAAVRDAHGVSDVNSVAWCVREDGRGQGLLSSCGDDGSVKVWRVVSD